MKKSILFIALILAFTLIIVGCGDNSQKEDEVANSVENNIEKEEVDNTLKDEEELPEQDSKEKTEDKEEDKDLENSLTNIFSKTDNIDSYYYEAYGDLADGTSYVTKIWFSENKTKMEMHDNETGENSIMIIDGEEEVSYIYMPAENMAIKMQYDNTSAYTEEGEQQGTQDYVKIMKEISDDGDVDIESGTLEGQSVKIVTGEVLGNTNKIWISNKTGFPLKSEYYVDGKLESTVVFKNFEEKSIDSSIFTLPEDVEIMDINKELEGISD